MSIMSPSSLIPESQDLRISSSFQRRLNWKSNMVAPSPKCFRLGSPNWLISAEVPPVIEQAQVRFRPESRGMYIPMSSESFVHKVTVHATPCPRMTL